MWCLRCWRIRGIAAGHGRTAGRLLHASCSLADAEVREDAPEQVFVAELTGDRAEFALHAAQFLGGEFAGALRGQGEPGRFKAFGSPLQCGNMAGARSEGAAGGFCGVDGSLQGFDQQRQPFAAARRQPQMGFAVELGATRGLAVEVDLVVHDDALRRGRQRVEQAQVRFGMGIVADQHGKVGALEFGACAAHAFHLDRVGRFAQAGGVDQGQGDAIEMDRFAQHVACGAGDLGDDRALAGGQTVEQAGLAGIRSADDDHVQAVEQAHAAPARGEDVIELVAQALEIAEHGRVGQKVDFLFGEIDGRLDPDAQAYDALGEGVHLSRKVAFETAHGGARGGFGAARDQVGDRFGLGQVDLAVEEGTLGELAGPRVARTERDATLEQAAQHDRAAMHLQLEHILAGERMRCRKVQQQAAIEHGAGRIGERAVVCVPRSRRAAEQASGERRDAGAAEADNADATGPRRRGDGGNRFALNAHRRGNASDSRDGYLAAAAAGLAAPSMRRVMIHCWSRPRAPLTVQ